jgi:hypothetical protein
MEPMRYPKWGDPVSRKYFSKSMGDRLATGASDPHWEKDLAAWEAEKQKRYAAQFNESTEADERMLTLEEARDVARRIFERIQKEL